MHAGGDVGDRAAGLGRFTGGPGHRKEARLALDQQVVGFLVAIGAGVRGVVAVAGDVAHDHARMVPAQGFVAQAQPPRSTRGQVLNQNVGTLQQAGEHLHRHRLLQVQRQALLGAVGPDEVRGQAAHPVIVGAREIPRTRALDLDDARAQVGKLARAQRRGDRMLERDDGDAVERPHRGTRSQYDRGSPSRCSAT